MKKVVLSIVVLIIVSIRVDAQVASSLSISHSPPSGNTPPTNDGMIKANVKSTIDVGLPDYWWGINLFLSPNSNGYGHAYQLNFNYDGVFYRRNSNAGWNTLWDPWFRLIMQDAWGYVRIDGHLDVTSGVRTTEVIVNNGAGWADHVFADDYQLLPLNEVKEFITDNKHLPGIPSEAEVKEEGVNLGEMQAILLQKIEELTLYAIQQQEVIEGLKDRIGELENEKK